jgi:hypothetical protein
MDVVKEYVFLNLCRNGKEIEEIAYSLPNPKLPKN